jgi:very-short-patch-repair endonuclease
MLDRLGILYESEAIFLNSDRFILADFYFKAQKVVLELDGSAHDDQKEYDAGRDAWLLRLYGVRTMRLSNELVMKKAPEAMDRTLCLLKRSIR